MRKISFMRQERGTFCPAPLSNHILFNRFLMPGLYRKPDTTFHLNTFPTDFIPTLTPSWTINRLPEGRYELNRDPPVNSSDTVSRNKAKASPRWMSKTAEPESYDLHRLLTTIRPHSTGLSFYVGRRKCR